MSVADVPHGGLVDLLPGGVVLYQFKESGRQQLLARVVCPGDLDDREVSLIALRLDGQQRRAAHAALRPDGQAGLAVDGHPHRRHHLAVFDPTLPKTRTGRFWVYIEDVRNPYVVYDYTPRRTRDGPERFLKGFRGYLQADAFSGYDRMCAGPDVIEVACWAHVRRKFFESRTSAPVLAHEALARIRQLYKIETAAEKLSAEDRRAQRQRDSVPSLTAFGEWLTEQGHHVLPKSPVGQ